MRGYLIGAGSAYVGVIIGFIISWGLLIWRQKKSKSQVASSVLEDPLFNSAFMETAGGIWHRDNPRIIKGVVRDRDKSMTGRASIEDLTSGTSLFSNMLYEHVGKEIQVVIVVFSKLP